MTDFEESILKVVKHHFDQIYTHIPAKVIAYDPKTQLAKLQPLIDIDGVKLNPIPSVPVHQYGGDEWVVAMKINEGTTGMLQVCMRDMSTWLFNSEKKSTRKFSLTDTTFSPGYRSVEGAIPNLANNGVQIRNKKGDKYFWMKDDGNVYTTAVINCKSMNAEDDCTAKGEVLTRISHTHPYIDSVGSSATPVDKDTDPAEQ